MEEIIQKTEDKQHMHIRMLRRRKRRRQVIMARTIVIVVAFFMLWGVGFGIKKIFERFVFTNEVINDAGVERLETIVSQKKVPRPEFLVDLITINEHSRPGYPLPEIKNIFVHYTANAGTTAAQNKSYFQNLKDTKETSASAHFIIGFDGEIIQCIPLKEVGYAVKQRNFDSISIECCYVDENGKFTKDTYNSLVNMLAWLVTKYDLTPSDILRHYDEGGKNCPKYYVENEEAWENIIKDVTLYIENNGSETITEDQM